MLWNMMGMIILMYLLVSILAGRQTYAIALSQIGMAVRGMSS